MARETGPKRRQPKASPARRAQDAQRVQRTIEDAINSGEIIAVGVLNLVKNTILTALVGVQDVGPRWVWPASRPCAARSKRPPPSAAIWRGRARGDPRNGDRGRTDRREVGGVARSAARGAVNATGEVAATSDGGATGRRRTVAAARDVGADVVKLARSAAEGAVERPITSATRRPRRARDPVGTVAGVRTLVRM